MTAHLHGPARMLTGPPGSRIDWIEVGVGEVTEPPTTVGEWQAETDLRSIIGGEELTHEFKLIGDLSPTVLARLYGDLTHIPQRPARPEPHRRQRRTFADQSTRPTIVVWHARLPGAGTHSVRITTTDGFAFMPSAEALAMFRGAWPRPKSRAHHAQPRPLPAAAGYQRRTRNRRSRPR